MKHLHKYIAEIFCFSFLLLVSCKENNDNQQIGDSGESESESIGTSSDDDNANAWLEIDTAQFARNIEYLKQIVGKGPRVCVVMKGDAYGNGISVLMPVILREGIQDVAITSNEEARKVREGGYKGRVVRIRLATEGEIAEGIELGIQELVGSLEQAEYINKVATEEGKTIDFHLAVNAGGMSRNGIELKDHMDEALKILQLDHLHCVGMMTHYPENKDEAIRQQLATFKSQTALLMKKAGLQRKDITLHTAATYATLYIPETRMDMVRVGSALYNYGYTEEFDRFKKILSFKSTVTSIQSYPEGNTVSYRRTHILTRPSRLANVPVGYANGINAEMANKGYMLVRGHRCPIVGNITMNITMLDVTDYPDIKQGDEVVIYGRQGNDEVPGDSIISWTGDHHLLAQVLFWSAANPKRPIKGK